MSKSKIHGNFASFYNLKKKLLDIPTTTAQRIAPRVAQKLTTIAKAAYTAGTTVYGDARPLGWYGDKLDLIQTAAAFDNLAFVAIGTIVRMKLSVRYAKFLVGKYGVLPGSRTQLPVSWTALIREEFVNEMGLNAANALPQGKR